jgi:ATP-dependent RNA helicase RhlE
VNEIREAVSALSSDIRKSLTTQPRGMSPRPACQCRKGLAAVASWKDYSLNSFNCFGLAEPILTALAEERYVTPTPIQARSIPLLLSGRDLIGIAQTGTGKTAAFALPILHRLLSTRCRPEKKTCRVLVLSPTRELSAQILASFRAYGRHVAMDAALAIGGVPMGAQVRALAGGLDVLVATPGRLIDLVRSNALRLSGVDTFVLDEADRMLDMGFIHDVRAIVAKLPRGRQTLLFSATMPQAIVQLAGEMLHNPATVAVSLSASTVAGVAQSVVHVDRLSKTSALADILRGDTIDRALVFTRTKRGADRVVRGLVSKGIGAAAIHGNKSQNQRERVLAAFRDGRVRTLIATDIAARGLDIDGVTHVINYDLPNIPESYVHRIGRTARAGAAGTAISLCSVDEVPFLRAIEKLTRMSIPATGSTTDVRSGKQSRDPQQPRHRGGVDSGKQRPAPQRHHERSVEVRKHRRPAVTHPHGWRRRSMGSAA